MAFIQGDFRKLTPIFDTSSNKKPLKRNVRTVLNFEVAPESGLEPETL